MTFSEEVKVILKHKDIFKKEIISMHEKENVIEIEKKNVNIQVSLQLQLEKPLDMHIFCENTKKNVSFLAQKWETFISFPNCRVTFVNNTAHTNWSISPCFHAKINHQKNILKSLTSIFESNP